MTEATKESPDQKQIPSRQSKDGILVQAGFTDDPVPSAVVHAKTKFWWGIWANKANENETESIRIGVNGETLTFQRGVETIVPEPYLPENIHARYAKFKQQPGQGRKVVSHIDRYPFTKIKEATFAEFRKMFLEGSKKTREAIAQHGLNIPISDAVPQLE